MLFRIIHCMVRHPSLLLSFNISCEDNDKIATYDICSHWTLNPLQHRTINHNTSPEWFSSKMWTNCLQWIPQWCLVIHWKLSERRLNKDPLYVCICSSLTFGARAHTSMHLHRHRQTETHKHLLKAIIICVGTASRTWWFSIRRFCVCSVHGRRQWHSNIFAVCVSECSVWGEIVAIAKSGGW